MLSSILADVVGAPARDLPENQVCRQTTRYILSTGNRMTGDAVGKNEDDWQGAYGNETKGEGCFRP